MDGLALQRDETARSRAVPWITRIEFRTEYEPVQRQEKEIVTEIVRTVDPNDAMKMLERKIPRETIRIIEETMPVDYVSWTVRPQSTGNVPPGFSDKVARVKKDTQVWPFIERHYEAWKKNEAPPEDGTPLSRWNRLSKAQYNIIKEAGFKTIEDFATAPSGHLMKLSLPGVLEIQKEAQLFLQVAGVMADGPVPTQIATQITLMSDENAALKARLAEMEAQMHGVLERYRQEEDEASASPEEAPRRGGWPKGKPRKYPVDPIEEVSAP